jgi:hypothetical protein
MIVIKLELWPGGDSSHSRPLGLICIANDGTGDDERGNYDVAASDCKDVRKPYKAGKVKGFRRKWSPYRLLGMALKVIGEI